MRVRNIPLTLLVALAMSACGAAAGANSGGVRTSGQTLTMGASMFVGATTFTLQAGQAITLDDPATSGGTHNLVTGADGLFAPAPGAPSALASPAGIDFQPGDKQSVTFAHPGTYHITCTIHPVMQATITVT
jgi:plastocyanin